MDYLEGHLSQMVVSAAAATCFAEQVSKSRVGTIVLDETTINKMFEGLATEMIKLDTTTIAHHLPLFREKLGDYIPLRFELSFSRM